MLSSKTFAEIQMHFSEIRAKKISNLFEGDNNGEKRAIEFTYQLDDLILDVSKNLFTKETLNLFIRLANEMGLTNKISAMFKGDKINFTEGRSVGHVALRSKNNSPFVVNGKDYANEIKQTKDRLFNFARNFRNGKITGYSGKHFDTVVNIGIGGSYLGSAMACKALNEFDDKNIRTFFISNIDGSNLIDIISQIDIERTLFIVASKTFTTQETIQNANTIKDWFINNIKTHDVKTAISKHFVALSTNVTEVENFGISKDYTFEFWDFVGGRYSLWSSIGLPLLLKIGEEKFQEFLSGANKMDEHLRTTPLDKNIPFIMSAVSMWNNNLFNYKSYALIAYDYRLSDFAKYLQQLEMESNGKSTNSKGNKIFYNTSSIIFGEVGTNSQHSFFQMLHQGTQIIPCEFIGFINQHQNNPLNNHQDILFANMLAQAEALMLGKSRNQVINEYKKQSVNYSEYSNIINHKVFDGNRPSTMLIFNSLTPKTLGKLCALYEHKILIQGILWNINSFDQFGVELGKKLSLDILAEIQKTPEQELEEKAQKESEEKALAEQQKIEEEKNKEKELKKEKSSDKDEIKKRFEVKMPTNKLKEKYQPPVVIRSSSTSNLIRLYKLNKKNS